MAATATKKRSKKKKLGRPPLGYSCPLLSFGVVHKGHDDWRIVMAREPARVRVTPEHVEAGIPGAANDCIFALAFSDHFGPEYDIEIGPTVTKIISQTDKVELRLHTPIGIAVKLREFDKYGYWDLPCGIYRFGPMAKGARLGKYAKKQRERYKNESNNVEVKTSTNRRTPRTKRQPPTRVIQRNAQIRWAS